jgi:hypothetical protein
LRGAAARPAERGQQGLIGRAGCAVCLHLGEQPSRRLGQVADPLLHVLVALDDRCRICAFDDDIVGERDQPAGIAACRLDKLRQHRFQQLIRIEAAAKKLRRRVRIERRD